MCEQRATSKEVQDVEERSAMVVATNRQQAATSRRPCVPPYGEGRLAAPAGCVEKIVNPVLQEGFYFQSYRDAST
jgi:hypothetical protein